MKYILIIILSLFSLNVSADKCDSKTKSDLLKEANQIKVDYDEVKETIHIKDEMYDQDFTKTTLDISLYNLTDNFSLEISNDKNNKVIYAENNKFKDGKYTFSDIDYYSIIKYKIAVYSNTSCDKYLIKNITYTKPMYNINSSYGVCQDNENISYCQKYITNPKLVFSMGNGLKEAIDKYKSGDTSIDEEENINFFKKYYPYILGGVGIVVVAGITFYLVNRKRSEI